MRVLLVDDSPLVSRVVGELVARVPTLALVGVATTAEGAIRRLPTLRPDVVIMDSRLPGMSGVAATAELRRRQPHVHMVGFTASVESALHDAFLGAGAAAVFTKDNALALRDYLERRAAGGD